MGETRPLISVILPTYNRASTIKRAIRSVLNQTYANLELIVVDDASVDDTETIVSEIKDERVRYLRHESNKGGGATRNTGIKAAKGDYIAFQDSDDEWLPQKLDKQMKVFELSDSSLGVVYTSCIKHNGNTMEYFPDANIINAGSSGFIHEKFLRYNLVTTQTALVRSECFKKTGGFDERLPRLQDWELWIRISKHYIFELINEPLVNVYYTSNSITFNDFAYIEAISIMLNKHRADFIESKAMTIQIGILARHAITKGDLVKNFNYIVKNILCRLPLKYSLLFILTQSQTFISLGVALNRHETAIAEYKGALDRQRNNYIILSKWFCNKSEGKSMELFFKDNMHAKVAIYGAGDLGLKLYKEMSCFGASVTCFIDNAFSERHLDNIRVLSVDGLSSDVADIVIVTPTYDFENIRNVLGDKGLGTVVSLEEVVNGMC